jgi:hypothetical protein
MQKYQEQLALVSMTTTTNYLITEQANTGLSRSLNTCEKCMCNNKGWHGKSLRSIVHPNPPPKLTIGESGVSFIWVFSSILDNCIRGT